MPLPISRAWIEAEIEAAARRLAGVAHRTPVHTSSSLDRHLGAEVFLKCESFQRIGAFKLRGAYNAIAKRHADAGSIGAAGVLTYSSGNHAQAVALVGKLLDVPTTIVMPTDAPRVKRAATEGYGARVVAYDPQTTSRKEIAEGLARDGDYTMIPPFDHPDVIAGQATVAVELHESVENLDTLLVPCGGGGLLSGCAAATRARAPTCRVVGVEPELADDAVRSFRTGTLQTVRNPPTIADGTRTASLGEYTFPLILETVDDMVTVSEAAIRTAMRYLFERLKLVIEPSGALGVAALLSGAIQPDGRIGVVLSGGNVDPSTFAELVAAD